MAFLRGAAERSPSRVRVRRAGGEREIARRACLRRSAAVSRGGVRRMSRLPARRRGPPSERVPGGAGGQGHPRRHDPGRGLAAGVPHRAGARTEGLPPPRGRPPVAAGGRHAAEGPRGAAGRRRPRAALRPGARAPRHRALAVSRRHVHRTSGGVRRRRAGSLGGGRRSGRGWQPASPVGTSAARAGSPNRGRHAVPRCRAVGDRAGGGRPRRSARSRQRGPPGGGRLQEGDEGRISPRTSRRSSTIEDDRKRPIVEPSGGSRPGSSVASAARSATTSIGCCSASPPSSAIRSPPRSAADSRCSSIPIWRAIDAGARLPVVRATRGMAAVEEARAALAEDINLNTRLVLERAFLRLGEVAA